MKYTIFPELHFSQYAQPVLVINLLPLLLARGKMNGIKVRLLSLLLCQVKLLTRNDRARKWATEKRKKKTRKRQREAKARSKNTITELMAADD